MCCHNAAVVLDMEQPGWKCWWIAVLLAACATDEGSASEGAQASTQAATDASTSGAPSDTSTGDGAGPSVSVSTTVSEPTDESTSFPDDPTDDPTGNPSPWCGIEDDPELDGPYFEIYNGAAPLEDGDTWTLQCGDQGTLMFYLRTVQGNLDPMFAQVSYAVTVDVEGFNDISPTGHFFDDQDARVDVACPDGNTFLIDGIAVFPPDALTDLSMIDGLPATLRVELLTDGAPPPREYQLVLAVPEEDETDACQ